MFISTLEIFSNTSTMTSLPVVTLQGIISEIYPVQANGMRTILITHVTTPTVGTQVGTRCVVELRSSIPGLAVNNPITARGSYQFNVNGRPLLTNTFDPLGFVRYMSKVYR